MRFGPFRITPVLSIALALLAPAATLAQTEIVVWHGYRGGERAAFEKVVAEYNKARAGKIVVKTLAVPFDALPDKISAAVPRGKGPDVFIFAQDRLGGWADTTAAPIDFYVEADVKKRFLPLTLDAMTYRDTIYGLPINFKVITMIYNKDLVKTPPKTSGELVKLAKQHTDAAAGKFGLAYPYADFYYHAALMNAFGGAVFDQNRKPTLDRPENIKALELMMKWYDQDGIMPAEASTTLITTLFIQGRAAIVFSGPWFLGELPAEVNFGLAKLPKIDEAGGTPMKPWTTVEGAFISAPSEHQDEAYDFIEFLTDKPAALIMALDGGQTPSNLAVYDDQRVKSNEVLMAFYEQAETAVPMPNYREMKPFWGRVTTAMNRIVRKTASPASAMADAQKELLGDLQQGN